MNALNISIPYAVQLKNVSKVYHGSPPITALADVSINVVRGDFLGIIGASGSGKSTLLHVVGTLTRPTSGSLYINGIETSNMSDGELSGIRSKNVGFIFQDFSCFQDLQPWKMLRMVYSIPA